MATRDAWSNPQRCPFCGDRLESSGAGFMTHVAEAPECEAVFSTWRERVGGDVAGGWTG